MRRVLVLGGSGALGSALVTALRRRGAEVSFTYHRQEARARELAEDLGARALQADLRRPGAVAGLFRELEGAGALPEAVVHCAGWAPATPLADITVQAWEDLHALHGRAALQCAQEMDRRGLRGALVLVAALDGLEPVPAPAHFAASQGALGGLALALAKELGPKGILVNLAVVGALEGGISQHLDPALRASYVRHAALGRTGTCEEAARALCWLALENTYMNGARLPLGGGLA